MGSGRARWAEVPGNGIVITRCLCLPPRPSTLCAASWSVAASPPPGSGEGVKHWKHWNGDQLKYGDSGMLKKNALLAVALTALVVAAPLSALAKKEKSGVGQGMHKAVEVVKSAQVESGGVGVGEGLTPKTAK